MSIAPTGRRRRLDGGTGAAPGPDACGKIAAERLLEDRLVEMINQFAGVSNEPFFRPRFHSKARLPRLQKINMEGRALLLDFRE
jgi:hypothetical protein